MLNTIPRVGLILSLTLPLLADEALKPPIQVIRTEDFDFAPGGTIRVDHSFGDLYVEAWDQPQVEITVTKLLRFEPAHPERSSQRFEALRVMTEKRSPTEFMISMKPKNNVRLELQLRVPRDSKLAIHHGVGTVSLRDVKSDIQATCSRGDIVVWLADGGTYSIDARSRFGKVSSDFPGSSISQFLVGQKFMSANSASAPKLFLRAGFGGITIKPILPESEVPPSKETK